MDEHWTSKQPIKTLVKIHDSQKPQTSGWSGVNGQELFFLDLLFESHMNKWEMQLKLMHQQRNNTWIGFN